MIPFLPMIHSALGGGNQFASGGLLLMAVGTIGASMRKVPARIVDFFERKFTLQAVIPDEVTSYPYFMTWLREHYPQRRLRKMLLHGVYNHKDAKKNYFFGLGIGNHWFWHKGRPLMIRMDKEDASKSVMAYGDTRALRPETLTLRCLGRNKAYIESILQEVVQKQDEAMKKGCGLHVLDGSSWVRVDGKISRPLSSVILPEGATDHLMRDIRVFLDSKDWYRQAGIPYHRGYLLHGLPGTGKSSLVEGLAHELKKDIYLMHLSAVQDRDLPSLFADLNPGSVLLMEDVDCVQSTQDRESRQGDNSSSLPSLTLSGLLNVLDGLQAPDGVMYFMTTNHRGKLDPALIRPGRVDVQLEFGPATKDQAQAVYRVFNPETPEISAEFFANCHPGKTMAELQMVLMEGRNARMTAALEAK